MTTAEIVAIVLTAITGAFFVASFSIFAYFVIKTVKEKPADKLLGGFAITFAIGILFLITSFIFIAIVN